MLNKGVVNDSWRVDMPDYESFKSFESRNNYGIYNYGCLITPLTAQLDTEDDLKSDILSKVCCNTYLRSRVLDNEWQRVRQHVFDYARLQFGNVFDQIKGINISEDYSVLPIIASLGFNVNDFDITYYTINTCSDIIAIKLSRLKHVDDMLKELVRQISRKIKLKRGKSLIRRLIASKELLNDKIILVIVSEINSELIFALQLIREWTEIHISCLILNVINNDLFESHIPLNVYTNLRIYEMKVWDSSKIVDDLCKTLLFEPGFTTFLHHPNKILWLWESYYKESFSLSTIMLKLHELLYKSMYDKPLGFSARSLLDILGYDIFHQYVIPSILNNHSFNDICDTDWGKLALSRYTSMVLSSGINEPLIAYYHVTLNTNLSQYSKICDYELPGDNLDENIVHLAVGPLSKGVLQLYLMRLKYTIGLKISYELMKSELNDIQRLRKLIDILYSNEKYPTFNTCENLITFVLSCINNDNNSHEINITKTCNKKFDIQWFRNLFSELPFNHPLIKQVVHNANVTIMRSVNSMSVVPDWQLLVEIISQYKKCNAWTLFKNFKEQLPKSANVGIAAVRFTSALTSICQIMGVCTSRQKNTISTAQNSLAKSLSQLIIYRLPTI